MRHRMVYLLVLCALPLLGAERRFDFSELSPGQTPPGFRSTLSGQGKPGEWKIVLEDVPSLLPPLSPGTASHAKRPVLAQLSQDPAEERYPLLILDDEIFADFTLTTRFKLVSGSVEQMAGLAFRIQDEKNYYYVRASGLGNTFYFFKFVNGNLIGPIGSKVEITRDAWHELAVECRGSQITCSLDGKVIIPQLMQDTFGKGKIGFWTKSDAVSQFCDTHIVYKPVVPPVQTMVQDTLKKYTLLLGLKVYIQDTNAPGSRVIASKEKGDLGQAGGASELDVITHGTIYYGKENDGVNVIWPLRDRNGDIMGALRLRLRTFAGQTEQNALARARPIVHDLETRLAGLKSLLE